MTQPNTDLLYTTLDRVLDANVVGTWDQGSWIDVKNPEALDDDLCGTTACFAGHALLAQGGQIMTRVHIPECTCADCGEKPYIEAYGIRMPEGFVIKAHDIESEARRALGLHHEDAERLFHSDNRLDDLKQIVDEIAARA